MKVSCEFIVYGSVHINNVMVMDCSFLLCFVDIVIMTQSCLVVICKCGFRVPRRDLKKALRRLTQSKRLPACSGYSKLVHAQAH